MEHVIGYLRAKADESADGLEGKVWQAIQLIIMACRYMRGSRSFRQGGGGGGGGPGQSDKKKL